MLCDEVDFLSPLCFRNSLTAVVILTLLSSLPHRKIVSNRDYLTAEIISGLDSDRIIKIGQHLTKLQQKCQGILLYKHMELNSHLVKQSN